MGIESIKSVLQGAASRGRKGANKTFAPAQEESTVKAGIEAKLQQPQATKSVRRVRFDLDANTERTYGKRTVPALPAARPWADRLDLDDKLRALSQDKRDDFMERVAVFEDRNPGLAAAVFNDPNIRSLKQGQNRIHECLAALPAERPWSSRPELDYQLFQLSPDERNHFLNSVRNLESIQSGLAAKVFAYHTVKTLHQGLALMIDFIAKSGERAQDMKGIGAAKRVNAPVQVNSKAVPVSVTSGKAPRQAQAQAEGIHVLDDKELEVWSLVAKLKGTKNRVMSAVETNGKLKFFAVLTESLDDAAREGVERAATVLRQQPRFFDALGQREGPVTLAALRKALKANR